MNAVFLDAEGLDHFDLSPIRNCCNSFEIYATSPPEFVPERIQNAELLLVNKVKIGREHFENAKKLKLISLVATGTDVIDLRAAADFNVTVCNCRNYGTESVVQHVFSLILALYTNLITYHTDVQNGCWQKATQFCFLDYPIFELKGKTLGIVGYGTLGKAVATVAKAFGMEVKVCRRPGGLPDRRPSFEEMLPLVDILSLHCPLTEHTKNLINQKTLQLMKPSAILINCARGGLVEEKALLSALQTGKLSGAAVDVLREEPPKANPLLEAKLPNLIVTPHIAWASHEARERIIDQTAENINGFINGNTIRQVSIS